MPDQGQSYRLDDHNVSPNHMPDHGQSLDHNAECSHEDSNPESAYNTLHSFIAMDMGMEKPEAHREDKGQPSSNNNQHTTTSGF